MSSSMLAAEGGSKTITTPFPHFQWPPPIPELPDTIAEYIRSGGQLSIIDRSGIYEQVEDRFCELLDRKYAILMSSGTMALYSAYFGLGLKPGDEVISTVYSFHATATPLLHFGVKIKFCDIEPDTGNIDPLKIESLITPKTKAVVTNHMWGHPVDADSIKTLCQTYNLRWVEDCSHAHFAEYRGQFVGTFGDASVFSLQGNKLVTGGEGGILLTNSTEIYERATLLGHSLKRSGDCVRNPALRDICRTGFGLKLRMHPLAAVMVMLILEKYCFDWIKQRAETLDRFSQGLAETGQILPMARKSYVTSMGAHYGFKPRIDPRAGIDRSALVDLLQKEGLDISIPGSPPFNRLPIFDPDKFQIGSFGKEENRKRNFPGADEYYNSILSLPTFTFKEDWPLVDKYIRAFHKVLN